MMVERVSGGVPERKSGVPAWGHDTSVMSLRWCVHDYKPSLASARPRYLGRGIALGRAVLGFLLG